MALKGNRVIPREGTDITATCETTGSPGQFIVYTTSGSGIALGDSRNEASVVANPSGYVVHGMLLHSVVNIDETRYHRNFYKDETNLGEPCNVARKGTFTTNLLIGTPAVGNTAYLSSSGYLEPTLHATGGIVARPKVGIFRSIKDADGYAKIELDIPIV